jgi:uncharacterized protein (DUF2236 family)
MMWRVSRESVLLVGGRSSLLMQLAHPLVAAGVGEHSRYRTEPLRRLRRTMDAMHEIVFGDKDAALARVEAINAIHDRVQGIAPDGRAYGARDPRLLLWVYATLVDASLSVYEAFVRRLTPVESAMYYEESKVVAGLFGIPQETIPSSVADLRAWMDERIASGEVAVTPGARDLAEPLLRPIRLMPRRAANVTALMTSALLPEPIRSGYGLSAGPLPDLALAAAGRAFRSARPFIPDALTTFPSARRAIRMVEATT